MEFSADQLVNELSRLQLDEHLSGYSKIQQEEGSAGTTGPYREPAAFRMQRRAPPAMARGWDPLSRWKLTWKGYWRRREHINIQELRVISMIARRCSLDRKAWKKILVATDSKVALGAVSKGRSSSGPLLRQCRMICSVSLVCQIRLVARYLENERNPADGPSRMKAIGAAAETILAHKDRVILRKLASQRSGCGSV